MLVVTPTDHPAESILPPLDRGQWDTCLLIENINEATEKTEGEISKRVF